MIDFTKSIMLLNKSHYSGGKMNENNFTPGIDEKDEREIMGSVPEQNKKKSDNFKKAVIGAATFATLVGGHPAFGNDSEKGSVNLSNDKKYSTEYKGESIRNMDFEKYLQKDQKIVEKNEVDILEEGSIQKIIELETNRSSYHLLKIINSDGKSIFSESHTKLLGNTEVNETNGFKEPGGYIIGKFDKAFPGKQIMVYNKNSVNQYELLYFGYNKNNNQFELYKKDVTDGKYVSNDKNEIKDAVQKEFSKKTEYSKNVETVNNFLNEFNNHNFIFAKKYLKPAKPNAGFGTEPNSGLRYLEESGTYKNMDEFKIRPQDSYYESQNKTFTFVAENSNAIFLLGLDNSKIKFLTVIDKSGKMIYGD
jgi:hypothetical protein